MQVYKLYNSVPQDSPLPITLFNKAFNKVSAIISSNTQTQHFIYTDNVVIFTKIRDLIQVKRAFLKIVNGVNKWPEKPGVKI